MKSLFEKEEKENAINQLKIELISRFYPLSNNEIIHFQRILNFGYFYLMDNQSVVWSLKLIDYLKDKIDWLAIGKLKNITLDLPFFKKFEKYIDFKSIYLSKNIDWSDELIDFYEGKFDLSKLLIRREQLCTLKNLRKFNNLLDWSIISKDIRLNLTDEIIEEFKDKWDWVKLSSNPNLPISVDFIKKHLEKLDFEELSKNSASLPLIYKYPTSKRWNWEKVIINRGLIYTQVAFDFIFPYFKKDYESKDYDNPKMKRMSLPSFLVKVFIGSFSDKSFFLSEKYIKFIPWDILSRRCDTNLNLDFINTHKENINFKEHDLIRRIKDVVTTDFIIENRNLFDSKISSFYDLPLTIDIIQNCDQDINWNSLSSCVKLDWTWDFIYEHFNNLNHFRLGTNRGIYERLMEKQLSKESVLSILEKQATYY